MSPLYFLLHIAQEPPCAALPEGSLIWLYFVVLRQWQLQHANEEGDTLVQANESVRPLAELGCMSSLAGLGCLISLAVLDAHPEHPGCLHRQWKTTRMIAMMRTCHRLNQPSSRPSIPFHTVSLQCAHAWKAHSISVVQAMEGTQSQPQGDCWVTPPYAMYMRLQPHS